MYVHCRMHNCITTSCGNADTINAVFSKIFVFIQLLKFNNSTAYVIVVHNFYSHSVDGFIA